MSHSVTLHAYVCRASRQRADGQRNDGLNAVEIDIHSCSVSLLFGVKLDGLVEVEVIAVQAQGGQCNCLDGRCLHSEVRETAKPSRGGVVLRELGKVEGV